MRRPERTPSLNERRLDAVVEQVVAVGGGRVVDLGCGGGRLLERLRAVPSVTHLVGVDVSATRLRLAAERLGIDGGASRGAPPVVLLEGSVTRRDDRLRGFDVALAVEVIEHVEPDRLDEVAEVLLGHLAPTTVVLTTPNREYNVTFEGAAARGLRHGDHRFEWTRDELARWVDPVGERYGYRVATAGIGNEHPRYGHPTQMAVLTRQR